MKYSSNIARLVLVISLPLASLSYGMQMPQTQQPPQPGFAGASLGGLPDTVTMIKNVWGLIKQHPYVSALLGGGAALVAYRLATMNSGTGKKRNSSPTQNQAQHAPLLQGLAFILQHAQQAVQLYQQGAMPRAYLYKKYCEIAKQSGIDRMPHADRTSLFQAVIGFDVAFSGTDYRTKQQVGLQAAVQGAYMHLAEIVQQLHAKYGGQERRVQSTQSSQDASPVQGIFQLFMQKLRENPIATISLILSSGYSLLAQFNGWPPYGPAQASPAQATAPAAQAPESGQTPAPASTTGVD